MNIPTEPNEVIEVSVVNSDSYNSVNLIKLLSAIVPGPYIDLLLEYDRRNSNGLDFSNIMLRHEDNAFVGSSWIFTKPNNNLTAELDIYSSEMAKYYSYLAEERQRKELEKEFNTTRSMAARAVQAWQSLENGNVYKFNNAVEAQFFDKFREIINDLEENFEAIKSICNNKDFAIVAKKLTPMYDVLLFARYKNKSVKDFFKSGNPARLARFTSLYEKA